MTLPKAMVLGESVTEPDPPVPAPESDEVCGLLESVSETLSVAVSVDAVLGVKTITTVQVLPAATVPFTAGHVLLD